MLRDRSASDLGPGQVGQLVRLAGWVHAKRDHGGVCFFNLRDRSGIVQVVAHPEDRQAFEAAQGLGLEYVVALDGTVEARPAGTENPKLSTGAIEVRAGKISLLNPSKPLPFMIEDEVNANEETRLKYRYLDLRRPKMLGHVLLRHAVAMAVRRVLDRTGFLEVETPILTKATPEGARDYLVPSRLAPGSFYALPQSPQILKQILMVSGIERYFQLARCMRDEDLRADRQPEFSQIDLEMSFVEEADVHAVVEDMLQAVFKEALGVEIKTPFARMDYAEVMRTYGSDKPDTRFGFEIKDCTLIFRDSGFKVFADAAATGTVRGLKAPGPLSRAEVDRLGETVKTLGAKGLAWIEWKPGGPVSPIVKFLRPEELDGLSALFRAEEGDFLFFCAGPAHVAAPALGGLRKELIANIQPDPKTPWSFLWVTHFPLLEWSPDENHWTFAHNPFTAPLAEELSKLDTDPGNVRSHQYDLVLNGVEIASGSIRNHRSDVQRKILSLMGYRPQEMDEQFGLLLNALDYGAPPHGGIALGYDRLIAILRGENSIREVIAFPKTAKGVCPLSGAPSAVLPKQLQDLGIRLDQTK
ncbi:MAG: aspartate--tRNA ligase [Elusimicrobia bacterium]|nr:aspartate--tRNA ligase [Elusimicrobiota bacterium]